MALMTSKNSQSIPQGAVIISADEALEYQKSVIRDWHNDKDVFFLRYGTHIASSAVVLSSIIINRFCIRQFKLKFSFPMAVFYAPVTAAPLVIVTQKFEKKITDTVLLSKMKCPLCSQMRYMFTHLSISIVYPLLASTIILPPFARKLNTIVVPDFKDARVYFRFLYSIIKPGALMFQTIAVANGLLVLFLPYIQNNELKNINQIILKMTASQETNMLI